MLLAPVNIFYQYIFMIKINTNICEIFAGAVMYYYSYKRTALRLGDPRFYQDSQWIRNEFDKRR